MSNKPGLLRRLGSAVLMMAKPKQPYFKIQMLGDVAEIQIYGVIGEMSFMDDVSLQAKDLVKRIGEMNVSTIRVRLNTPGGWVMDAIAIYNALLRHPATIETYNDAEASSAGSYLMMAGTRRVMASNALMMVHAPWAFVPGNAKALREHADLLDRQVEQVLPAYVGGGVDEAHARQMLTDGKDHFFLASEALAAGLITEVDEALPIAALHDFSTHSPPESVLKRIPELNQSDPSARGLGPDPVPGNTPKPRAQSNGVQPMKWKVLAKMLLINLANDADESAARKAVCLHYKLAETATDDEIAAQMHAASGSQPVPAQAAATPGNDSHAAAREVLLQNRDRQGKVTAVFDRYRARAQHIPDFAKLERECMNDFDCDEIMAGSRLLSIVGGQAEPVGGAMYIEHGEDGVDKRRNGMTQALLMRSGMRKDPETDKPIVNDRTNPFRGTSLRDLARMSLQSEGIVVSGMSSSELADTVLRRARMAGSQTTSDFLVVLENTMHKVVISAGRAAPQTFRRYCKIGSVSDYRDWNRLTPGMIATLDEVDEKGNYRHKPLPDAEKLSVSAKRRGNIVAVTVEVIVNDDLGLIVDQAGQLGMAGPRTVERQVQTLLAQNNGAGPTITVGGVTAALFSADFKNIAGSGGAPGVATLSAGRKAMMSQTAPGNDKEPLEIVPAVALAGVDVAEDIKVVVDSKYDPDAASKLERPNKVRGLVSDSVGTARITDNRWYLFADPLYSPVLEVVYLDGQEDVRLVQDESFESGGLAWRGDLSAGVGVIGYRGGYFNAGAA